MTDVHRRPADLRPDDLIVLYYDEGQNLYHFASWWHRVPSFWKRTAARIVEVEELEGTSTASEMIERGAMTIYRLGQPNACQIRFFVGEHRYTQRISGDFSFEVLPEHHPVCIECVEPWPCRDHRQELEGRRLVAELNDVCNHCGKKIGAAWSETVSDGTFQRRYHLALKYRGPDGRRCSEVAAEARQITLTKGGTE